MELKSFIMVRPSLWGEYAGGGGNRTLAGGGEKVSGQNKKDILSDVFL
jgi:hypothetical protein